MHTARNTGACRSMAGRGMSVGIGGSAAFSAGKVGPVTRRGRRRRGRALPTTADG